MTRFIRQFIISLAAVSAAAACSGPTAPQHPQVHVSPVYAYMRDYPSSLSAIRADSVAAGAFMRTLGAAPADTAAMAAWAASRAVEVFTPDVDSVFSDSLVPARAVAMVLDNGRRSGLAFPERTYATVVYGRPESILFVDSVMLIALNHYLGADYPGYAGLPEYMRDFNKTPGALPYDIAEALVATSYPFSADASGTTLLSRMLYEGAIAAAKIELVDNAVPARALGYTDEEYRWLADNEAELWRHIVGNRLLFDTSPATVARFVLPSPRVNVGPLVAPGRVGRYIGYRIVQEYLRENSDTPLAHLLSPAFYTSRAPLTSYTRQL